MKAIIYLRISDDRTGLQLGVSRQREDCERKAAERGLTVAAIETDNDLSAYSGKRRPGFENVLKSVKTGKAQVVIAWSLDRLQRNRRDELRLYEACRDQGAQLALVNGADLDFSTAAGRFVADALGSVARMEVEMKSDRQRRAAQQAAAAGKRAGGRRPFGYDADGMQVRPAEAAAVAAGFESFLAGMPLGEIARVWNEQGFVTGQARRGANAGQPSPWTRSSVRDVLSNPRYMGKRAHKGEIVADALWPALVPEETWQAAQAILTHRSGQVTPNAAKYLLSGIGKCGVCGGNVHAGANARRGVRGYRCAESTGHFARKAEPVEEYVAQVIAARLSLPDAGHLLTDSTKADLPQLRAEATALRQRLNSLATDFADGELTAQQLRAATARINEKLAAAEHAMADAGRVDVLGPLIKTKDVRAAWDTLRTSQRRAVIDILATVTLHPPGRGTRTFNPDTVSIEWKLA
ncbi:recombinase family protein [Arthrobacter pascens]|uniref:recombinase family protein n=1 Tax=Arthrobacter pascens TaxID=1677 RepID=UPI00196B8AA0|nr:recombinase family protein [Arthrobacter pascens]MBN3498605.1 recombinase family protein [Arthrobacter pascens]